jgi:predicted acylesterase/phospholipase RssA
MRAAKAMLIPPRRLMFSGGGIRVVSYLGVLDVLKDNLPLSHVREFCGVSAGGLVALLMALGYSHQVFERFCMEYNFGALRSVEPEDALTFFEEYGFDDGANLKHFLERVLHHKGFISTVTFGELALSGRVKSLRIWASDIQNLKPIEFSALKTPDIQVTFALRASMAFPLYFIPLKHPETGLYLVDGGVFDNYPMSLLTDAEAEETLGFTFEISKRPVHVNDLGGFISLLTAGYYMPSYQKLLERHKDRTIVIGCGEFPSLNFEATQDERSKLIENGRAAGRSFLERLDTRRPQRRHSVA